MSLYYLALIDGEDGAFGVSFPDAPGCVAMGDSVDEALASASEALREWVETEEAANRRAPSPSSAAELLSQDEVKAALTEGAVLTRVLLIRKLGRPTKANLSLDSGVLAAIDAAAERLHVSRSALIERMAEERLPSYA